MKTKDWFAFLGLALAWGSSFLWIKIAVEEIGPFLLVAFRLLFGIIGLLLVVAIKRPEWPKDPKVWRVLVVLGFIQTAIPFVLISWGEQFIDSAVASILNGSVPLFTTVLAHFYLKDDRLSFAKFLGLFVGFAGILVLVWRDLNGNVQSNILGQAAVLLAAISYAIAAVYARQNTKGVSNMLQALIPLLAADVFLWTITPFVESPLTMPVLPITWISLIWLGLIGSCLAYLLYYYLIHSIGPSRATMVTYLFPVIGVILGVFFLDEVLDWYLAAGSILVIASLWIVNRKKQ